MGSSSPAFDWTPPRQLHRGTKVPVLEASRTSLNTKAVLWGLENLALFLAGFSSLKKTTPFVRKENIFLSIRILGGFLINNVLDFRKIIESNKMCFVPAKQKYKY